MSEFSLHRIFNNDCLDVFRAIEGGVDCIFADPPDNLRLAYGEYADNLDDCQYIGWLENWLHEALFRSPVVWLSFNVRWIAQMGRIASDEMFNHSGVTLKPCVQTFTFGQHNKRDLGGNHRPLWRFSRCGAPLYPDAIRVPSWRQLNGDKRADPRGRVPGDVFDFPRVTGNSKQRRRWIPTQLHEGLVERCLLLTTKPGDLVLDPFAGSGTTLRVCKRINRRCILAEIDSDYCRRIAEEHDLTIEKLPGENRTIQGAKRSDPRFLKNQQTLFPVEKAA